MINTLLIGACALAYNASDNLLISTANYHNRLAEINIDCLENQCDKIRKNILNRKLRPRK